MKLYTARSTIKNRETCQRLGVGLMMVDGWTDPAPYPHFAIDNGCFSAWKRGAIWDPAPFLKNLHRCQELGLRPDFAVLPDIVAGGEKSLKRSRGWSVILRELYPDIPFYVAVQDGMNPRDHGDEIISIADGIFVGGTTQWKLATMRDWARFAHEHGMNVHVGRIGTPDRMVLAHNLGIDSIDSTTWVQRNGSLEHHVTAYMRRVEA